MDPLDPLSLDYTHTIIDKSTQDHTEFVLKLILLLSPLVLSLFHKKNDPFIPLHQNNYQDIKLRK